MDGIRLGRVHRRLRVRLRLRQADVATKARLGREKVVRLEAGEIDDLTCGEVDRCFAALGAHLRVNAVWHGAAADRLLDEAHARLVGLVVQLLQSAGWRVEVEVTFSDYGERGSIDVFAWHPQRGALAVFEIKTELGGVDPLLRPLDIKVRLAPRIAYRLGWRPVRSVSRIVVFPEDRTVRRHVGQHSVVLTQALPVRSRELRRWLPDPTRAVAGLWFLSNVAQGDAIRNPSSVRRVRRPKSRSADTRSGGVRTPEAA